MEPKNALRVDTLKACRFCSSMRLSTFISNRLDKVIGVRVDVETVQCFDCGSEAPLNIWNSKPDDFKSPDFSTYGRVTGSK